MANQDPATERYISRVRAIPRLSREDEHELALKSREGDREATNALVEANLRFVVAVALQYRRYAIPFSELLAEGNLGLMMAVRKFDPDRGTRFVTYAGYWIRAYVLDLVVRSTTLVGAGAGVLRTKVYFRLRRERAQVASLTNEPLEQRRLLAERFGVTEKRMAEMLRRVDNRDISLDSPAHRDSTVSIVDTLASFSDDQEFMTLASERQGLLQIHMGEALSGLDDRERYIVEQRYMLDERVSLASLGRSLGVSRERARQLEVRAKKKLKRRLEHLHLHAA